MENLSAMSNRINKVNINVNRLQKKSDKCKNCCNKKSPYTLKQLVKP